jgi:hypothetical protein
MGVDGGAPGGNERDGEGNGGQQCGDRRCGILGIFEMKGARRVSESVWAVDAGFEGGEKDSS